VKKILLVVAIILGVLVLIGGGLAVVNKIKNKAPKEKVDTGKEKEAEPELTDDDVEEEEESEKADDEEEKEEEDKGKAKIDELDYYEKNMGIGFNYDKNETNLMIKPYVDEMYKVIKMTQEGKSENEVSDNISPEEKKKLIENFDMISQPFKNPVRIARLTTGTGTVSAQDVENISKDGFLTTIVAVPFVTVEEDESDLDDEWTTETEEGETINAEGKIVEKKEKKINYQPITINQNFLTTFDDVLTSMISSREDIEIVDAPKSKIEQTKGTNNTIILATRKYTIKSIDEQEKLRRQKEEEAKKKAEQDKLDEEEAKKLKMTLQQYQAIKKQQEEQAKIAQEAKAKGMTVEAYTNWKKGEDNKVALAKKKLEANKMGISLEEYDKYLADQAIKKQQEESAKQALQQDANYKKDKKASEKVATETVPDAVIYPQSKSVTIEVQQAIIPIGKNAIVVTMMSDEAAKLNFDKNKLFRVLIESLYIQKLDNLDSGNNSSLVKVQVPLNKNNDTKSKNTGSDWEDSSNPFDTGAGDSDSDDWGGEEDSDDWGNEDSEDEW
jgi:hypothetical protein